MSGRAGADDRRSSDRPMSSSADPSAARTTNRSPPVAPRGVRSTPWAVGEIADGFLVRRGVGDHGAGRSFAEQRDGIQGEAGHELRASIAPQRHPGDGQNQPARSHVLGRGQEPPVGRGDEEPVEGRFPGQVQVRQRVIGRRPGQLGEGTARQALHHRGRSGRHGRRRPRTPDRCAPPGHRAARPRRSGAWAEWPRSATRCRS